MISFRRISSDEGYRGFFIDWIEQWSQFFVPCNWRTFNVAQLELEDDRLMGGVEMTLVVMGLGLRARWNYRLTQQAAEIRQQVEDIKSGKAQTIPSCGCVFCDVELERIESAGKWWHVSPHHPPVECTRDG